MSGIKKSVTTIGFAISAMGLMAGCGGEFHALPDDLSRTTIASERSNGRTATNDTTAAPALVAPAPAAPAAPVRVSLPAPTATPRPVTVTPTYPTPAPVKAPVPIATPIQTVQPAPVISPQPTASGEDCSSDVSLLGWQSLASRENVQVYLRPSGMIDFAALGYPERVLTSSSVQISFFNPYRPGSSLFFRNSINYGLDGYRIEFIDRASNARVAVDPSELDDNTGIMNLAGQRVSATAAGTAPDAMGKLVRESNITWFNVSRGFYSRIQNFGVSTVSLYCKGVLVAKGEQDVSSIRRSMLNGMKRSIQYAPGQWGYTFDETTPTLSASVECPLEIAAGATGKCTLGGYMQSVASGTWYVDGVATKSFSSSGLSAYQDVHDELMLTNNGAGSRKIEAVVKYKDGTEERRGINLVKFK